MGKVKQHAGALSSKEREDRIHRALVKKAEIPKVPWSVLSLEFGIPASTLNDRFNGRKNRQEAHQSQQKLSPVIEKSLKKWIQDMDDAGFPPRVDLLRGMASALAQNIAEEDKLDLTAAIIGRNWVSRFLDRHPDLASKYSTQLDRQRQNASNPVTLRDYFNKHSRLVRRLIPLGLRPSDDIYNFDEKGFILGYSAKAKVICRSGRRNPNVAQDGSRELITVVETVSVGGLVLPPWVIYKGKGHYMGWHQETNDANAVFAYSNNGWTDNNMGLRWLREHFDVYSSKISGTRPRLLVMDGHGSHLTYEFCSYALSHNIYLICLPAHSTHLLQPLDVGLFGPLQHYYGKAADNHIRETRTGITKGTFWSFFTEARAKAFTKQTIQASFHATGIFPLNPDNVLTKVKPNQLTAIPVGSTVLLQKQLSTPKNRRELRQQTQFALHPEANLKIGPAESKPILNPTDYSAIILRLSHLAEEALTQADIAKIQLQDLRVKYEGKRAIRADRRVLSKAQVITGAEIIRLKNALEKKEMSSNALKDKLLAKKKEEAGDGTKQRTRSVPTRRQPARPKKNLDML